MVRKPNTQHVTIQNTEDKEWAINPTISTKDADYFSGKETFIIAPKTSVPRMILQAVEDFATIVKGEVEIAKKSLTTSVKKLGLGIGFVITAFLLLIVSLLFLLIALAYGFIQIGLAGWISFLLVAAIMIALAVVFIILALP